MELLLNLIWLVLALVSIGAWWMRWSPRSRGRRQRSDLLRSALGLTCVLVLLFFAISLTDDLQQVAAVAEDLGSPRRPLQVWKASPKGPEFGKQETSFAGILVSRLMRSAAMVVGRVFPSDEPLPQTASRQLLPSRAPPRFAALSL